MKMVFQWNGAYDPLKLEFIRRIPCMYGIAASLGHVGAGELWPEDDIRALRETIAQAGLSFEVISALPVHEDIVLRRGAWAAYVNNYKENIARLAKEGVKCICYGFDSEEPGYGAPFAKSCLEIGLEGLWENIRCFIDAIIPVASKCGMNMAMYSDDGSMRESGAPNFISSEDDIDKFLAMSREKEHGLAMCSSLDMSSRYGYRKMVRKYGAMGRVHFADLRNVKILEDIFFVENEAPSRGASIDMAHILKAFHDADFNGYVCPGSGHVIGGKAEPPRVFRDIALGATYLSGIWETLEAFGY